MERPLPLLPIWINRNTHGCHLMWINRNTHG